MSNTEMRNIINKIKLLESHAIDEDNNIDNRNIDVTSNKVSRQQISKSWPEHVVYKGNNIFNIVYEGSESKKLDSVMKKIKKDTLNKNEGLDDFQECYLGYSPKTDTFIQGYDGWAYFKKNDDDYEDFNCSPVIYFKINEAGEVKILSAKMNIYANGKEADTIWYGGANDGYKIAKLKFPDLIDIRLD